jgi:hypothetical protein
MLALAACALPTDVHPRALEVARDVGGRWCAHLRRCYPDHYAAAFPSDVDGVDACIAKGAAGIPPERQDTCDVSRVDTCRADVDALACATSRAEDHMPASCGGC